MNTTKILIADENTSARTMLRDELKAHSYANVYEATNGEEAMTMISTILPDIVIIDVLLSKLDGIGVIRQTKRDMGEEAPIFIVTSIVSNHNMLLEANNAGASMCMIKPVNTESLVYHIENLLPNDLELFAGISDDTPSNDLESQVTKIIHQIGVPAHIKGYQYLRTAIILTVNDSDIIRLQKFSIPPSQRNIKLQRAAWRGQFVTQSR